jgi:hypothetical protein
VRGGKTRLAIDIVTRGDSPREWVSAMTGTVRAVVGPATLANTKIDPNLPIDRIVDAVNPFRNVDPTTELKCAVIRLPLERGIARIEFARVRGTFGGAGGGCRCGWPAAVIARIGAAIGTSGLSVVGESLLAQRARGGPNPCDVALGRAPAAKSAPSGAPRAGSAPTPADDLGKALGRLLGR